MFYRDRRDSEYVKTVYHDAIHGLEEYLRWVAAGDGRKITLKQWLEAAKISSPDTVARAVLETMQVPYDRIDDARVNVRERGRDLIVAIARFAAANARVKEMKSAGMDLTFGLTFDGDDKVRLSDLPTTAKDFRKVIALVDDVCAKEKLCRQDILDRSGTVVALDTEPWGRVRVDLLSRVLDIVYSAKVRVSDTDEALCSIRAAREERVREAAEREMRERTQVADRARRRAEAEADAEAAAQIRAECEEKAERARIEAERAMLGMSESERLVCADRARSALRLLNGPDTT